MNSNKLNALLAAEIDQPTDFPKDSPSLRELDSAVRCPICGEYLTGPVTVSCGHCFCSMCIRSTISTQSSKALCPICKKSINETQLRPNLGMEEVVTAWKLARPHILTLAKHEEEVVVTQPAKKKRKLDPSSSPQAGSSRTSSLESSKSEPDGTSSGEPKPDAIVECPVCTQSVKYKDLNKHIDNNCTTVAPKPLAPTSKSQKTMWSDIMQPKSKGKEKDRGTSEEDHLPKVSYDTLKDKQLRDKLTGLGLSTSGERPALIARHQRWTMLWNANLDRSPSQRQSKVELVKELKRWEEERKTKKKKITVDESHLKIHDSEFKRLVAAARPKAPVAASTTSSPPPSSVVPVDSDGDVIVVSDNDDP
ncbi:DNA repair protein [Mycena sanguinolenta]|uniref:Postreplication repair E3 ubiquitin-protein ligase RAD18 n=1 Tax=Mycena sanguinolenta TaxID=230812 RepID=A0A8H6YHK9_9AGAR|nr:DNA repair protein [Mycena sanguinolenta]